MPQLFNVLSLLENAPLMPMNNSSETTDAAAGTSTNYSISVGSIFSGTLDGAADEDWVSATLSAGESYVVWVNGTGNANASVVDTILTVRDSSGAFITSNDDVDAPQNRFSLIEFTATTSGTYYFDVDDYSGDAGYYDLRLSSDVFTMDEIAAFLTDFGWGDGPQLAFDVQTGGSISYNIDGLTSAGQQLAQWALEAWGTAMGMTFVQTSSGNANMLFDDDQDGAFAGPDDGDFNTGEVTQSSINVSTAWLDFYGTTLDSYSYTTYLHEIGHALGLYHAGPYNGNGTYGSDNVYLNDSTQATIMSYYNTSENTYVDASDVLYLTPMIADLLAVHDLYGTAQAYGGDTVWGSNSNIGGTAGHLSSILFDGAAADASFYSGGAVGFAIYDTGGIDTLNFSNSTGENQLIDMRAESASDIGGLIGNVLIGRGTAIENAIGGAQRDVIIGNDADNNIEGRMGNDDITGNDGNDTLLGQNGNDTLDGGVGHDFLGGGNGNDALLGGAGNDTIYGASGNDSILGDDGNDLIYGLSENDVIDGGAGSDTIWGGGGNDTVTFSGGRDFNFMGTGDDNFANDASNTVDNFVWLGIGNDRATTGAGNDVVYGMAGIDVIFSNDGNDTVYSGAENDTVDGGAGDDELWIGEGDDLLTAGAGNDLIYARSGNDNVSADEGNDTVHGGTGNDTIMGGTGNDTLFGGDGNDQIFGGDDDDFIFGGAGNDVIDMGAGNDTFIDTFQSGSFGADTIIGGAGADTFQFTSQMSTDTITDFEIGIDTLRLTQKIWAGTRTATEVIDDFASVTSAGVVLDFGGGRNITLSGVFDTTNLADDLALF